MINHLNVQNFSQYGLVLHENPERAMQPDASCHILEDLDVGEELSHLYKQTSGELLIELKEGVALLSVSLCEDLSDLKTFLLDKKVVISRPLIFCIQALNDRCKVQFWSRPEASQYERINVAELDREQLRKPRQVLPNFDILCIYTLFYQEKDRGFRFKGENHPFWELTYVDKASLVTEVDGQRFELQQGDAIFYSPGQFHSQYSDADIAANFITISFAMAMQDESRITNQVFHLEREQVDILNRILVEKDHPSYFSDDLMLCYLKELVITIFRSNLKVKPVQSLQNDLRINVEKDIISRAMGYIHTNMENKISVAEIASAVHVSPSYLSALFKRRQKMTLVEYITHVKLERSKDLIREGNWNLTEISKALGFNSVHYYSRLFKNKYLISPSEYSRAIR